MFNSAFIDKIVVSEKTSMLIVSSRLCTKLDNIRNYTLL